MQLVLCRKLYCNDDAYSRVSNVRVVCVECKRIQCYLEFYIPCNFGYLVFVRFLQCPSKSKNVVKRHTIPHFEALIRYCGVSLLFEICAEKIELEIGNLKSYQMDSFSRSLNLGSIFF